MIAIWMAYMLVTGVVLALVCWLLEHVARGARLPTRGIWLVGIAAMLAIGAGALAPRALAPSPAGSAAAEAPTRETLREDAKSGSRHLVPSLRERVALLSASLEAGVAAAAGPLSRWDLPLLSLWALGAAFFAGLVGHAALEGRRLRKGLRPHDIAGTSVLLTDGVGPSAVGVGEPAILIPRWILDLDDGLMTLVLRHEREHVAARDPLLLLATLLAVMVVPWHLPLWWARKRLRLAIEVDCDRRVLRAHPDVRRYAQLLLLTAQRAPNTSWTGLPVVTVVAPLRPHASHLARRISAMTQPRSRRPLLRAFPLAVGVAALGALLFALPVPPLAQAQRLLSPRRALVHLTSLGLSGTGPSVSVLVYTTGDARVGVGLNPPVALKDTLRLSSLPAITADVTDGEVHIELGSPGILSVGGEVTGGAARALSASGRHVVLLEGGVGIHSR